MPLTDDDFLKNGSLKIYNEVITGLQETEEVNEELDYQFELDDEE